MRAVGARHVFGMGGRLPVVAPLVRRQSLAAIEDLDRVRGVADLDLLADQLERHAVDVALDVDVVVDVDAAPLPVRQDVTRGRQGPQRRAIDLLVQGAAADAQLLHGPVVAVDIRAVGPDPVVRRRGAWKQSNIEPRVVQIGRQRPADPTLRRPLQIAIDRPHAYGARLRHRLVGQSLLVPES